MVADASWADPQGEVAQRLRRDDPDRWIASLFAPADLRPALWALGAFVAELAGLRDRVREPIAGEVRLQWWHDVLSGERALEGRGYPLAAGLMATIAAHRLPVGPLLEHIAARSADLYDDPFADREALEAWCGHVHAAPIRLAAIILARGGNPDGATAAGHAGCALGMAHILSTLPQQAARGQALLPMTLLESRGARLDDLRAGRETPELRAAAAELARWTEEHLAALRGLAGTVPRATLPAFLPVASVAPLLAAEARRDGALFSRPPTVMLWQRILRQASWAWRGRIAL